MNADRLLTLYERIADAPDAVPRFRQFILNLAVRGKLVPQNPNDEPASELLKWAAAEKTRLVKARKLKKLRALEWPDRLETPFPVPPPWTWCRLSEIGAVIGGGTPSAADADNFAEPGQGIAWVTPADLGKHDGLYISRGARDLSERGFRSSSATLMPKGTVLFTSRAPIGYVAIAQNEITTNQGFKSVVPYVADCARYIAIYLLAFGPAIDSRASGTTFREVSGKVVSGLPFPLPPLAEQHRIVAKVDEMMALCDRLEAARNERESRRDRLVAASLARLDRPDPDPQVFRRHAAFALENLGTLTACPDQIGALRQTILNLAVHGKLVPQDPQDESASELLDLVRAEQEELIRAGALKRCAPRARAEGDIALFDLPKAWTWAPLGDLIVFGPQNGISPKPSSRRDAPKAITLTATTSGIFDSRFFKHVEARVPRASEYWLRPGDLLFQRGNTREYVGMAAVYTGEPNVFLYPDLMMKVRVSTRVSLRYIHICSIAPHARMFFSTHATGAQATMPKINQGTLTRLPIPLPPLAEQRRIVAKVDELMALCDRLEASLTACDAARNRLLDAVLREALAPAARELEAAE